MLRFNCSHHVVDHSEYKLVMNIIGISQFPFFVFSVYCILTHSPWSMASYKWLILIFQLTTSCFNISLTIFCTPIVFYPFLCGYPLGVFSDMQMSTRSQYFLTTFTLACVGASTTCLFEYRHQSVLPNFHILRHSVQYRVFKTIMYYLIAIFHVWIPMYVIEVEDRQLIDEVVRSWGDNVPCDIWHPQTIVLSVEKLGFLHFYYMGGLIVFISLSTVYAGHSFYIIRATRILLSGEMQKIQRSFLKGLVLQVLIPYSALVMPAGLGLLFFSMQNQFNQNYVQIGFCILSTHGILSTVTTILVHRPYRNFVIHIAKRLLLFKSGHINIVDEYTTLPNLRKVGVQPSQMRVTKF